MPNTCARNREPRQTKIERKCKNRSNLKKKILASLSEESQKRIKHQQVQKRRERRKARETERQQQHSARIEMSQKKKEAQLQKKRRRRLHKKVSVVTTQKTIVRSVDMATLERRKFRADERITKRRVKKIVHFAKRKGVETLDIALLMLSVHATGRNIPVRQLQQQVA